MVQTTSPGENPVKMPASRGSSGWDAFEVLQIANTNWKDGHGGNKKACPAPTLNGERCKRTRNGASNIMARTILNRTSLFEPSHFLKENEQLERLADRVLCLKDHLKDKERRAYVIEEWQRLIKDWIRAQDQLNHLRIVVIRANIADVEDGSDVGGSTLLSVETGGQYRRVTLAPPARQPKGASNSTLTLIEVKDEADHSLGVSEEIQSRQSRPATFDQALFQVHLRRASRRSSNPAKAVPQRQHRQSQTENQAPMNENLRSVCELTI